MVVDDFYAVNIATCRHTAFALVDGHIRKQRFTEV